jgi:putative membrane protein
MDALIAFGSYFLTALALLAAFIALYVQVTPYREFALIRENNTAAALALSGAVLGFTFPLLASIYYTQSLAEMALWAGITCLVQLTVFLVMRHQAPRIAAGDTAPAILLATLSVAVGLINALCISH